MIRFTPTILFTNNLKQCSEQFFSPTLVTGHLSVSETRKISLYVSLIQNNMAAFNLVS